MTTYAPEFVSITNTITGVTRVITNIISWEEDEIAWKGVERDAFDGTILSTLRTPRRQIRMTIEVNTGGELDAIQNHVGTGNNPATGRIASLARCIAQSVSTEGGLRVDAVLPCYVHVTRKTPWFKEEGLAMKTAWRADIELHGTI